jgi:hypothetical protein
VNQRETEELVDELNGLALDAFTEYRLAVDRELLHRTVSVREDDEEKPLT